MNKRKGKNRGRQGRSTSETRRNEEWRSERREESSSRNDVSWYSKYPNLLIAAGSFPYPYRPGMNLPLGNYEYYSESSNTVTVTKPRQVRVPGTMVLDWGPSIGVSNNTTDPASILSQEIYAKVRSKYSGALDADAPDFLIYIMALDSIYSYIAWLKRLYRLLFAYSPDNYEIPDALLNAMGVSSTSVTNLRSQKAQMWQMINELVYMSRKYTCPAGMDIINRHYWMSDNVYTDAASINSQFYAFNLAYVYKYQLNSQTKTAGLVAVNMPWVPPASGSLGALNQNSLGLFGKQLIQALDAWDDAYTINGYLKRAYESEAMFMVDEMPADQPFTPVYEPEVLTQIENSRGVPHGLLALKVQHDFSISQDPNTNAVISNPMYWWVTDASKSQIDVGAVYSYRGWNVPPVLSIRSDSPTVADNVIASRLQASVSVTTQVETNVTQYLTYIHCATEIPLGWRINSENTPYTGWPGAATMYEQTLSYLNGSGTDTMMHAMWPAACFDWRPFVFVTVVYGAQDVPTQIAGYIFGDVHNTTVLTQDELDNLHRVCIYSELNAFSA